MKCNLCKHNFKHKTPCIGLLSPLTRKLRFKTAKQHLKGNSFLDLGCSLGEIIPYLPKDSKYLGIESNKTYFLNAKHINPNQQFKNNTIEDLNIKDKFDTIIMLAILEHLNNPNKVLISLRKNLNDNGKIIISTPTKLAGYILKFGCCFNLFAKGMEEEHKQYFSLGKLVDLAKRTGYKIVKYKSFELGLNNLIVLEKNK